MATWARAVGVPLRHDEVRSGAVIRVANALLEGRDAVAGLDAEERASLAGLGSLGAGTWRGSPVARPTRSAGLVED